MPKRTDNDALPSKLAVRRHFLRRYHAGERTIRVVDCCEGEGLLWSILEAEFDCQTWGVDLKPKPGRLALDSRRLVMRAGLEAEVIDVDAYGSPWRHWNGILATEPRPLTVFLTWGITRDMGGNVSEEEVEALGLIFPTLQVPPVLCNKPAVQDLVPGRMLASAEREGWKVVEAKEAPRGSRARYFGVRLEAA